LLCGPWKQLWPRGWNIRPETPPLPLTHTHLVLDCRRRPSPGSCCGAGLQQLEGSRASLQCLHLLNVRLYINTSVVSCQQAERQWAERQPVTFQDQKWKWTKGMTVRYLVPFSGCTGYLACGCGWGHPSFGLVPHLLFPPFSKALVCVLCLSRPG
jgi:hypothetical protein